jgi:hypothetical protein
MATAAAVPAATVMDVALVGHTPQANPGAEITIREPSMDFMQLTQLLKAAEENRARDRAEDLARQEERDKVAEERRVSERADEAEARRRDKAADDERWRLHLAEQKAQSEAREREQALLEQRAKEERCEAKKAKVEERRLERLATEESWRARQAEQTAHQEAKEKVQRAVDDAALEEVRQNAIIDRDASSNASKRTIEMQMNMFEWMKESKEAQERKEKREVEEHEYRMSERRRVADERAASERMRGEAERQCEVKRIEELQREEAAKRAAVHAASDTDRGREGEQQALSSADEEARMRGNIDRECDALHFERPNEDAIDVWANSSPVRQGTATRPREERSGAKIAAAGPLANQKAKETEWPALALASEAVATVAPIKRSKRGPTAAVVGN